MPFNSPYTRSSRPFRSLPRVLLLLRAQWLAPVARKAETCAHPDKGSLSGTQQRDWSSSGYWQPSICELDTACFFRFGEDLLSPHSWSWLDDDVVQLLCIWHHWHPPLPEESWRTRLAAHFGQHQECETSQQWRTVQDDFCGAEIDKTVVGLTLQIAQKFGLSFTLMYLLKVKQFTLGSQIVLTTSPKCFGVAILLQCSRAARAEVSASFKHWVLSG